jgi:hypothetical protein
MEQGEGKVEEVGVKSKEKEQGKKEEEEKGVERGARSKEQ